MRKLSPKEFFESRPPFFVTLDDAMSMVNLPEEELLRMLRAYAIHCATASPPYAIISRLVNAFTFDKSTGTDGEDFTEQSAALNEARALLDKLGIK